MEPDGNDKATYTSTLKLRAAVKNTHKTMYGSIILARYNTSVSNIMCVCVWVSMCEREGKKEDKLKIFFIA